MPATSAVLLSWLIGTRFAGVVRSVVMSFSLEWIGQHLIY